MTIADFEDEGRQPWVKECKKPSEAGRKTQGNGSSFRASRKEHSPADPDFSPGRMVSGYWPAELKGDAFV